MHLKKYGYIFLKDDFRCHIIKQEEEDKFGVNKQELIAVDNTKRKDEFKAKLNTRVDNNLETLEYYESLIDDIGIVFDALLTAYIHNMLNLGKPFLIPTEYFLKDGSIEEVERWRRIIRHVNHVPVLLP